MNGWIVFAAVASTAITGLLTWWLYRLNAASEPGQEQGEGDAVLLAGDGDGGDGGGD